MEKVLSGIPPVTGVDYILFGGTTEGRVIARSIADNGFTVLAVVATEYGEEALDASFARENGEDFKKNCYTLAQRLDEGEMTALLDYLSPAAVIDATHPYAALVSRNIRRASEKTGQRYIRVLRRSTRNFASSAAVEAEPQQVFTFASMSELVKWLNRCDDVIFSTLGAKDLQRLAEVQNFERRIYVRILPTVEGISECRRLGFPMKHIYALHGPFSEDFNIAQFRESGAGIILTKDTGLAGGFDEKIRAAEYLKIKLAILERPLETSDSISLDEILKKLNNKEAL